MHKNAELDYETFPISWRWVESIPSGERVLERSNGIGFSDFSGFSGFSGLSGRWVIISTKKSL